MKGLWIIFSALAFVSSRNARECSAPRGVPHLGRAAQHFGPCVKPLPRFTVDSAVNWGTAMKIEKEHVILCAAVEMLEGLTVQEAVEFHDIDATVPYGGLHVWPSESLPCVAEEQRWLELWQKHQAATVRRVGAG